MALALAIASSVAKATCCGLGTAGAQSPRRSGAVLRVIRTRSLGSVAARLRISPNGAAISLGLGPGAGRAPTGRTARISSKSSTDSVSETWSVPVSSGAVVGRRAGRVEVLEPAVVVVGAAEEDRGSVGRGDGAQVGLLGLARPGQHRGEQPFGSCASIRPGRRSRRPARRSPPSPGRPSLWCEVQQDPGAALLPQLHRLGAMLTGVGEAEGGEGARDEGSRDRRRRRAR